jgi:hydroxypyruvate isomerase
MTPAADSSDSPTTPSSRNPSRRQLIGAGLALAGVACVQEQTGVRDAAPSPPIPVELPGQTAHTRFAMNLEMWWRDKPFVDRIRAAAALGFRDIEFWGHAGKDLHAIAEVCGELNISVAQFTAWGFVPGANDPKNHDAFVRGIDRACEVAEIVGAPMATVVGGNDQPGMTQRQMHDHIITALQRVAPIAEAAGLMLILEPMNIRVDHKGHCLYGSEPALAICRAVNSPMVKINWDLYHMQITEGDLVRHMEAGWDQVGYLQLADNPGRTEPGTGEIAYTRVLKAAWDLGYRKPVGVECYPSIKEEQAAWALHRADRWSA